LGWYAYNEYNILLEYGQNAPTLLLNDIASKIHEWLNSLKNSINLADENKTEKFKMIMKAYTKIGMSSFIKGCIDFLRNLYNVEKLDEKIDANKNILSFENLLYDLEIGNFRKIRHNDYIIKNTKYNINIKSNSKIRERINKLLYSIFENDGVITFWKISTALSIFGKSFESLYIHTGTGRNGKGVLTTLLKALLGDYFLTTDNTFLTTIFKSGQANSTLAQSKGVRFLLVTEPDNGTADCSLNIDFVKLMTGGDEISARDLYAKASTFKPFFSLLLQCNQKPKLNKIDKAIEERLKIIHYPFTFVDNPTHQEERIKDNNLKDLIIEQEFINEFILMLLEVANENKNIKFIELPEEVKQQNKEYLEENNNILTFINEYYEITKDEKNKIKSSDLLTNYNAYNDSKTDAKKLKQMMEYNRFKTKRFNDGIYYTNLILKKVEVILEPSDFD
jgi:putative DNA primase/helicase